MLLDDRGRIAQALFDFLERDGMEYCMLGDTRACPESIRNDLDIAVRHETFSEVPETIARFCRQHDVRLVQLIRHERTAQYFVLAWTGAAGAPEFLAVDVCSHYLRKGRWLLGADELLDEREPAIAESCQPRRFYVPSAPARFIYYLLKKVDKGHLDDGHGDYLSLQWHLDPGRAWTQVSRFWTRPADARLIAKAAVSNDWSDVRVALPELRRSLHRAALLSPAGVLGELRRHLARVRRPSGLVLAVLGPDGCGKSTLVERILADLSPAFRGTAHLHLRPLVITTPRGRNEARTAQDPHGKAAWGKAMSVAKLLYLLLDYTLGYVIRIWPLALRSTLVAFDRYYYDLIVDAERFRYAGPMSLARRGVSFVPDPDMCVLLDAPASVLPARKSAVPLEESERRREEYLKVLRRLRHTKVVDASRPPQQVAAEVESAVLNLLERRLEARYPELREHENALPARLLLFFCRKRVPLLSKLFRIVFNSDIHCRMRSPVLLPYPYGIIIHSRTVIGSRVTVMQQVTIGSKGRGENMAPVIEDGVYIGAGARVLGGIRVGRGAVIGANAIVTRDVPPHCTVIGANRILRRAGPYHLNERGRTPGTRVARAPLTPA